MRAWIKSSRGTDAERVIHLPPEVRGTDAIEDYLVETYWRHFGAWVVSETCATYGWEEVGDPLQARAGIHLRKAEFQVKTALSWHENSLRNDARDERLNAHCIGIVREMALRVIQHLDRAVDALDGRGE